MADKNDQQQQDGNEPSGEPREEVGFGAAFAERASDPSGGEARAREDGEQPSNKEPAEAGSEKAPSGKEATGAETSGTAVEADPLADLTPEQLRQRLAESEAERVRLQASNRSNIGRVSALTRKLNKVTAAPATDQSTEDKARPEESERAKRLQAAAEEYPDVVGALTEALSEVQAEVTKLKKAPASESEIENDAAVIAAELEKLERAHPDFERIAADPNFDAWLKDQPAEYTQLVSTFDATKVGSVLTLYKAERSAAATTQSSAGGEPGKQEGTATDDRRKRQLDGSRQVRGSSQPAAAGVPKDFSSAFKARASAAAD